MSHELRTPLNSILGFAQLLQQSSIGPLTDRQGRYIGNIETSGQHLLALVNDLLDLTKIEAGEMNVSLEDVGLEAVVDEAVANLAHVASAQGLRLVYNVIGAPVVRADRRRLLQVLLNLLSNAVKFTPVGGAITVTATQTGALVEILVTDTGIGIPPEEQERIFDEFHQVESDPAKAAVGTGLGLALTRRFVERMNGAISVRSQVGEGSTFVVALPAANLLAAPVTQGV
jgi:two-component system, cell cycle sensor histidine kinase PleC